MKLKDIIQRLNLEVLSVSESFDKEVKGGYCADLLSDVMGNASEGDIWITLQTHKNIIAVAVLKEVAAIILVKGLKPDIEVLTLAETEGIPILNTNLSAFKIAGKLYQILNE